MMLALQRLVLSTLLLSCWNLVSAFICTGTIGLIASAINGDPLAESFCSFKFPLPAQTSTLPASLSITQKTTTVTSTAGTNTQTITASTETSVVTSTISTETDTSSSPVISTITSTGFTTLTTTSGPPPERRAAKSTSTCTAGPKRCAVSTLMSYISIYSASASAICACIETAKTSTVTPATITITVYPTSTSSITVSTTTTITPTITNIIDATFTTITTVFSTSTTTTDLIVTSTTMVPSGPAPGSCAALGRTYTSSSGVKFDIGCGERYRSYNDIATYIALSFQECLDECALAQSCCAVNYDHDTVCTLADADDGGVDSNSEYDFAFRL